MTEIDWKTAPALLEVQCPVSRLSKESYNERKGNLRQTLPGLGKWWGRKPLVLVRATIFGLLLPSTGNHRADREVFLALMTMDDDGLWRRKRKNFTGRQAFALATPDERGQWFGGAAGDPRVKPMDAPTREIVERTLFARLSYPEKLKLCAWPEEIDGPSPEAWSRINAHLGTHATTLVELVGELGQRRFGHRTRVGDAFSGGGSIPFEAARIGCEVYATDLNPVATLLTWASIHIIGGGALVAESVRKAQRAVYDAVDRQVTEWRIEHDESGRRADAYLYCNEVCCPECGWMVPLAPAWVIGEKTRTIAVLVPVEARKAFDIRIRQGVDQASMIAAKAAGTADEDGLHCPRCTEHVTPMTALRGDRKTNGETAYGLRLWESTDLVPRPGDVFQERLYCIRWVDAEGGREYAAPTESDLARERQALELLRARLADWQEKGYLPSRRIEPGDKTSEPIRTRGWTHWHHLFTPRQLLTLGTFGAMASAFDREARAAVMLGVGRCADYNNRCSRWHSHGDNEKVEQLFSDNAINPLANWGCRAVSALWSAFEIDNKHDYVVDAGAYVGAGDARLQTNDADLWITDPPYADAISYHELRGPITIT